MADAAQADADVKLYKASSELLAELQAKIPLLLYKGNGQPRRYVIYVKTAELCRLLDSFQEWPQLLDPVLAKLAQQLADAFLYYCINAKDSYHEPGSRQNVAIEPLPRAVCRLLYVLCKVRGHKVIVRLLNNEPKYIEPMLVCFHLWKQNHEGSSAMSWEESYIVLLWLSHLMFAPFQLATISGITGLDAIRVDNDPTNALVSSKEMPSVARILLEVAGRHLFLASKDREAAGQLIVRLCLRSDMQEIGLAASTLSWCTSQLLDKSGTTGRDQYRVVGLLTLLFGLTNSSTSSEASSSIKQIFGCAQSLATDTSGWAKLSRGSAPVRKLLIKILRSATVHALSLARSGDADVGNFVEEMLEDTIQILLECLADSDTPVRQAASKALGVLVLNLDRDMAAEVISAVIECLGENMLLENRQTGALVAVTDLFHIDQSVYKKNVNAVDPLKWHGAMLTLGHVLFRRSPPPEQLSSILESLILGLQFEQRSSVGTSLGVGVRDAACFGIWSLARKYTTSEIEAASLSSKIGFASTSSSGNSILQRVAVELVGASCFDPSGNLRRGASAALQELIGRHPDKIECGIPVVQLVDYHAVARRSKALLDISTTASRLHESYHLYLLYASLEWRGCRAVDAESRRRAAQTIGILYSQAPDETKRQFLGHLFQQMQDLKPANLGINAASRHGLVLALAAIIYSTPVESRAVLTMALALPLQDLSAITGQLDGRVTNDLINVLEAVSELMAALITVHAGGLTLPISTVELVTMLDRCVTASEDDVLCDAAAEATAKAFHYFDKETKKRQLNMWLPPGLPNLTVKTIMTCKGRVKSLSRLMMYFDNDELVEYRHRLVYFLTSMVSSSINIDARVNAMNGIVVLVSDNQDLDVEILGSLTEAVLVGLSDYSSDQRGDVGSWLRLASIQAAQELIKHPRLPFKQSQAISRLIARLSAEKLTKVRFAAWQCFVEMNGPLHSESTTTAFEAHSDVSSIQYFSHILSLLDVVDLRTSLLKGLFASIGGGTDDISEAAVNAFVSNLNSRDEDDRRRMIQVVVHELLAHLQSNVLGEDRVIVPFLESLILILEQFLDYAQQVLQESEINIVHLLEALENSNADIGRIQLLIRLMTVLSLIPEYQVVMTDKITRKLLHKWPKIRQAAAESAYLRDHQAFDISVDWNASAAANKGKVVELRKLLNVAGKQAINR